MSSSVITPPPLPQIAPTFSLEGFLAEPREDISVLIPNLEQDPLLIGIAKEAARGKNTNLGMKA